MADLQPGSLPTTFTGGADTDYLTISRGAQTGRMLRSEVMIDIPRIYATPAISGNTTITAAAHAWRSVRITSAAACTFSATGAVEGDEFQFVQDGAGALTLTGANVILAPGVASATTNGDGSVLHCRYRAASGGQLVAYFRTAAAAGGGAGNVTLYGPYTGTLPTGAGEFIAINQQSLGGAMAAGSIIKVYVFATPAAVAGGIIPQYKLNGTAGGNQILAGPTISDGVPSRSDCFVASVSAGSVVAAPMDWNNQGGVSTTAINLQGGTNTFTVTAQRLTGGETRTCDFRVFAEVTRA